MLERGQMKRAKNCEQCGRPFTWRKKWERCWDEVRFCSEKCKKEHKRGDPPSRLLMDTEASQGGGAIEKSPGPLLSTRLLSTRLPSTPELSTPELSTPELSRPFVGHRADETDEQREHLRDDALMMSGRFSEEIDHQSEHQSEHLRDNELMMSERFSNEHSSLEGAREGLHEVARPNEGLHEGIHPNEDLNEGVHANEEDEEWFNGWCGNVRRWWLAKPLHQAESLVECFGGKSQTHVDPYVIAHVRPQFSAPKSLSLSLSLSLSPDASSSIS